MDYDNNCICREQCHCCGGCHKLLEYVNDDTELPLTTSLTYAQERELKQYVKKWIDEEKIDE